MTLRSIAAAVPTIALALACPAAAAAGAEDPLMPRASTEVSPPRLEDVWNDPGFRKSFVSTANFVASKPVSVALDATSRL